MTSRKFRMPGNALIHSESVTVKQTSAYFPQIVISYVLCLAPYPDPTSISKIGPISAKKKGISDSIGLYVKSLI